MGVSSHGGRSGRLVTGERRQEEGGDGDDVDAGFDDVDDVVDDVDADAGIDFDMAVVADFYYTSDIDVETLTLTLTLL